MYPTKRFDQEERLSEHARRHAQVLDAAMGDTSISGALGWCAFDYNTHRDFGSGDRICYHGVSDIFRIPKYAAALYASQADPSRGPVLVPAGRFAKGERSAARMLPIEVFTNCDAVDLYRAGRKVGRFFPDRKAYPHLPHPPVLIDDFIGDRIDAEGFSAADKAVFLHIAAKAMTLGVGAFSLADKLRFGLFLLRHRMSFSGAEALVIKYGLAWGSKDEEIELVGLLDGREALRKRFGADARAERLALAADQEVLSFIPGDEWNAARVLVSLEDQRGNPSPFSFLPVNVSVEGCGRLLGPSSFSLVSGEAAFWIATTGAEGPIAVQVSVPGFPAGTLALRAERSHG